MPCLPGGILADEMGLGKTLEVLGCILMNPRTNVPIHTIEINMEKRSATTKADYFSCICGNVPASLTQNQEVRIRLKAVNAVQSRHKFSLD